MTINPLIEFSTIQGLVDLYAQCLANKQTPQDIGLPALPDPSLFVVEDGDHKVVVAIRCQEDFDRATAALAEKGETVASEPASAPEQPSPQQSDEPAEKSVLDAASSEPPVPSAEQPAKQPGNKKKASAGAKTERPVPETLRQQIVSMADLKQVQVPDLPNSATARKFWRELQAMPMPSTEEATA